MPVDRPPSKASWQRPASPMFYPAWRQVTAQARHPVPRPPWTCRHRPSTCSSRPRRPASTSTSTTTSVGRCAWIAGCPRGQFPGRLRLCGRDRGCRRGAAGCPGAARGPYLSWLLGSGPGCRGVLDPLRQARGVLPGGQDHHGGRGDPNFADVQDLEQLPEHLLHELENFFDVYKMLEPGTSPTPDGYEGPRGRRPGGRGRSEPGRPVSGIPVSRLNHKSADALIDPANRPRPDTTVVGLVLVVVRSRTRSFRSHLVRADQVTAARLSPR
jgi:hypothetical protein